MIKTALIIAAGRGIRMGPAGKERPKGFIEIEGEIIIKRSIRFLFQRGIERIEIVTGHLPEFYNALVSLFDGRVQCHHNSSFATSGSLESLRVGLERIHEPFLLLESDIIYQSVALDAACDGEEGNILLVSGPTHAGDEVYVWGHSQCSEPCPLLKGLSKNRNTFAEEPLGEMVGITRIGNDLRHQLADRASNWRAVKPTADYEAGLVSLASTTPISCLKLPNLIWAEIDDLRMLDHVQSIVYPRLRASENEVEL